MSKWRSTVTKIALTFCFYQYRTLDIRSMTKLWKCNGLFCLNFVKKIMWYSLPVVKSTITVLILCNQRWWYLQCRILTSWIQKSQFLFQNTSIYQQGNWTMLEYFCFSHFLFCLCVALGANLKFWTSLGNINFTDHGLLLLRSSSQ